MIQAAKARRAPLRTSAATLSNAWAACSAKSPALGEVPNLLLTPFLIHLLGARSDVQGCLSSMSSEQSGSLFSTNLHSHISACGLLGGCMAFELVWVRVMFGETVSYSSSCLDRKAHMKFWGVILRGQVCFLTYWGVIWFPLFLLYNLSSSNWRNKCHFSQFLLFRRPSSLLSW